MRVLPSVLVVGKAGVIVVVLVVIVAAVVIVIAERGAVALISVEVGLGESECVVALDPATEDVYVSANEQ